MTILATRLDGFIADSSILVMTSASNLAFVCARRALCNIYMYVEFKLDHAPVVLCALVSDIAIHVETIHAHVDSCIWYWLEKKAE